MRVSDGSSDGCSSDLAWRRRSNRRACGTDDPGGAMSLQAVFAEIHPDWYHRPSADGHEAVPFDDALLRQARDSALGRRMLARWLLRDIGGELLAPRPDEIGRAHV